MFDSQFERISVVSFLLVLILWIYYIYVNHGVGLVLSQIGLVIVSLYVGMIVERH